MPYNNTKQRKKKTSNEMKFKIKIFLIIVVVAGCASCTDDLPSTIERCKFEDDDCMVKAWNKLTLVAEKDGIPELDLPISNKHFVDEQKLHLGSNVLTLTITFQNVTVLGVARTTFKSVRGFKKDPKQTTGFELTGVTPYISVSGHYFGSGKLLLLPVAGNGYGEIKYYNTTYKITVFTKTETRDGEEYLKPTKIHTEYQSERNHFRFDNILNNKEISDGLNKMANENQDIFGREVNRPSAESFSKVFKEPLVKIFRKYPYRKFFLE